MAGRFSTHRVLLRCSHRPIATWQVAINGDPEDWHYREELEEVYEIKMENVAVIILWKDVNHMKFARTVDSHRLNGDFEEAISTWKIAIQEGADEKHMLGFADAHEKPSDEEKSVNMKWEAERMARGR